MLDLQVAKNCATSDAKQLARERVKRPCAVRTSFKVQYSKGRAMYWNEWIKFRTEVERKFEQVQAADDEDKKNNNESIRSLRATRWQAYEMQFFVILRLLEACPRRVQNMNLYLEPDHSVQGGGYLSWDDKTKRYSIDYTDFKNAMNLGAFTAARRRFKAAKKILHRLPSSVVTYWRI